MFTSWSGGSGSGGEKYKFELFCLLFFSLWYDFASNVIKQMASLSTCSATPNIYLFSKYVKCIIKNSYTYTWLSLVFHHISFFTILFWSLDTYSYMRHSSYIMLKGQHLTYLNIFIFTRVCLVCINNSWTTLFKSLSPVRCEWTLTLSMSGLNSAYHWSHAEQGSQDDFSAGLCGQNHMKQIWRHSLNHCHSPFNYYTF